MTESEQPIEYVDDLMRSLVDQAQDWFDRKGWRGCVVVNIAWTDNPDHGWFAAGGRVPNDNPDILAESLERSAGEARR